MPLVDPTKAGGRSTRPQGFRPFYIYDIRVDGVVRYVGKGRDGRINSHLVDAKRTATRPGVKVANLYPFFRRKLVQAIKRGTAVRERIVMSGLSEIEAYEREKQIIGDFHKNRTGQLWNTIDERFIDPKYLPDKWSNPVNPLYRLPRPLSRQFLNRI